jgi:hypothetical protein
MSAELRIVGELVQVRMLRSVDGYGRRGTLAEVGLDVAAGLMENRLAEYLGVTAFVVEGVAGGTVESAAEPRGGKGNGARRRKAGSRRSDTVDAEPGEGVDAG